MASMTISSSSTFKDESMERDKVEKGIQHLRDGVRPIRRGLRVRYRGLGLPQADGGASAGSAGSVCRDGRSHGRSPALAYGVAAALLVPTGRVLVTADMPVLLLLEEASPIAKIHISDGTGAHQDSYLEDAVTGLHLWCAQRLFNFLGTPIIRLSRSPAAEAEVEATKATVAASQIQFFSAEREIFSSARRAT